MSAEEIERHRAEFKSASVGNWTRAIQRLFPHGIPSSCTWIDPVSIVEVLMQMVKPEGIINHMFIPSGGGMDLVGAELGAEPDTVGLVWHESSMSLVRPESLTLNTFTGDEEWSYFRLETKPMRPSGTYESEYYNAANEYGFEEVLELSPGEYVDRSHWTAGFLGYDQDGQEQPLPERARIVTRYFGGGPWVLFAKGSAYNQLSGRLNAYNALHEQFSPSEFRDLVQQVVTQSTSTVPGRG